MKSNLLELSTMKRTLQTVSILLAFGDASSFHSSAAFTSRCQRNINIPLTRTRTTTRLDAIRCSPNVLSKLISPLGTSTIAIPMSMSSAAVGWKTMLGVPDDVTDDGAGAAAQATESLVSIATTHQPSPLAEAHLLTDFSHVALDLISLFGPARLPIQIAAVIGRLCSLGSDWIPDHIIAPDELAFQLFMLGLAWAALVRSALPMVLATISSDITVRDGKAYSLLFGPAGMTWSQFKALSLFALDWETIEPGKIITTEEHNKQDDYTYWLYRGDAIIQSQGQVLHNVTRSASGKDVDKGAGTGLFGERPLLYCLKEKKDETTSTKKRRNKRTTSNAEDISYTTSATASDHHPRTTVKAGSSGATVLRIHNPNLSMLMSTDQELTKCMRTLVLQGMQDKLSAQLKA